MIYYLLNLIFMLKHLYPILLIGLVICPFGSLKSQSPPNWPSGKIQLALKKMQVLGSVLYIAAHPDDENTAMLAYLANDRLVRTAYLSLTRGDGGQNLIGPEQRELMGLIRTQELLQARRIDGAEQFFSRANDFGYSKNAQETFEIWEKDKILGDVVRMIRKYRPDVIITRFPPNRAAGHGHHEAATILALEAFKAAADPQQYPEQLEALEPWQVKRVLWNAYSIRGGRFTNLPPESLKPFPISIGTYNPLLGKSHQVIASESRSMHRSQGFGSRKDRKERIDNLGHLAGEAATEDLFDGIITTWNRIPQGAVIQEKLEKAYQNFKSEKPADIVPELIAAYREMQKHPQEDATSKYWIPQKTKELKAIIKACLGLWLDALALNYTLSPGDSLDIRLEVLNRSARTVHLKSLKIHSLEGALLHELDSLPQPLENAKIFRPDVQILLPETTKISQPYWLVEKPSKGVFTVSNEQLIGKPENDASLVALFSLEIEGEVIEFQSPVQYKWTRPDEGELYRSLEISPSLMVNLDEKISLFVEDQSRELGIQVKAGREKVRGVLNFDLPAGWAVSPSSLEINLNEKGEEKKYTLKVKAPSNASEGDLRVKVKLAGQDNFDQAFGIRRIEYPHIPIQTVFPEAKSRLIKLDLKKAGNKIAYIQGAGDEIPLYLRQVGFYVEVLDEKGVEDSDLSSFDAVVLGVRAYNTQEWLRFEQDKLLEFVKEGGTMVVQYQTNRRLVMEQIGPYPLELSRKRVTVEEAPIKFLDKAHPLLNYPNKIDDKDFEGWVQERGLYFASEWDERYQAPISSQDPGEEALKGGLLYAEYGQGKFVYTGLSFFRELPAGVSGAYRLLVNLIARREK